MAEDLASLLEEQQRRQGQVTGGTPSVLAPKEDVPTLTEVKRAVTSLLKGATKGIVDLAGGWGTVYDAIKENKTPSALSGVGIANAIAKAGGPDIMKIQGYKGLYEVGQAGAPAAVLSAMAPGSGLFNLSTPARTVAAEFGTAGTLGMLSQQVAPESIGGQVAMQTLPYLVKGGITGLRSRAQQQKIEEYKKLLPSKDANTFSEFMLRGQGSSDPVVAADITRLSSSPKYLELVSALNEGASAKAVSGMAPKAAPLTAEQSKVGIIQSIQNKLEGIRDSKADSLFEKAKGYGAGNGLVSPDITLQDIAGIIGRYSLQATPNAERAVEVLQGIRDRLQPVQTATRGAQPGRTITGPATDAFGTPIQPAPSTYRGPAGMSVPLTEPTVVGGSAARGAQQTMVPKLDALGKPVIETYLDAAGMPHERPVMVSVSSGGSPATSGITLSPEQQALETTRLVGSKGKTVSWQNAPNKLTVEQVQGLLSEFGKKASMGENLLKDLSISDERIISSAIFGGLKDDMSSAIKATTGNDKAALNLLSTARDKVATASNAYRDAVAQGLPKFLKDKTLAEISPEELFSTYTSLTPVQRATMRSWVGNTDQAALSVLDKQVFDNFVSSAKLPNATGVETVDLSTLAKNWRGLNAIDKDALVTALGTNANEFGKRMSDAELFTRKIRTTPLGAEPTIAPSTVRETSAVLGAASGYGPAKVGQLSMDLVNSFGKNGLTEDQVMKALMTPEGASFLKNASMSPRSTAVLDDLAKMEQTNPVLKWTAGTLARVGPRVGMTEQPAMQPQPETAPVQDELQLLLEEQANRQGQQQ